MKHYFSLSMATDLDTPLLLTGPVLCTSLLKLA